MRKLGEQWVEEIGGIKHMLKLVPEVDGCRACFYYGECDECVAYPKAQCNREAIIKDLGILNDEGLLPCPFCGEYPKIIYPTENMPVVSIVHTGGAHRVLLEFFRNKQQAIDAWNRRA